MEKGRKFRRIAIGASTAVYIILTATVLIAHRRSILQSRESVSESAVEHPEFEKNPGKAARFETARQGGGSAPLSYRRGEVAKTIEQYEGMRQKRPHDPEIHLALGRLYMGNPQTSKAAEECLEKVLELEPSHPKRRVVEIWLGQLRDR